jgi:predicted Co/Zn/Cd cation transporter (cation efflux family)
MVSKRLWLTVSLLCSAEKCAMVFFKQADNNKALKSSLTSSEISSFKSCFMRGITAIAL